MSDRRHQGLDILRALAIILVLGNHIFIIPEQTPEPLQTILTYWSKGGWIGVDLFFVLSGFLVSGLLFQEYKRHAAIQPIRFLVRRGLKIYPAFYVFLLVTLVCGSFFHFPKRLHLDGIIGELLFIQNYYGSIWSHTWTLAVEEHFYILLAITFGFTFRKKVNTLFMHSTLFIYICILCIAITLVRFFSYDPNTQQWTEVLFPSHFRIDSLLFGVGLSSLYHFRPQEWLSKFYKLRHLLYPLIILCALPPFVYTRAESPALCTWGVSLLTFGFGLLVLLTAVSKKTTVPHSVAVPLCWIGRHSYSIYLWHLLIADALLLLFPSTETSFMSFSLWFILYITGSILIGGFLSVLIEFPVLKIRDKILPSRSGELLEKS